MPLQAVTHALSLHLFTPVERALHRAIQDALTIAVVEELDYELLRMRVRWGPPEASSLSRWLPWIGNRSGETVSDWNPPQVGEACLMLAPFGIMQVAMVLGAVATEEHAVPEEHRRGDRWSREWADGSSVSYDGEEDNQTMALHSARDLAITCKGTLTLRASSIRVVSEEGDEGEGDIQVSAASDLRVTGEKDIAVTGEKDIAVTGEKDIAVIGEGTVSIKSAGDFVRLGRG